MAKAGVLTAVIAVVGCNDSVSVNTSADEVEASVAEVQADKIFYNGKIVTVNDDQPKATVVAVKDGDILYVGDIRGAKPLIGDTTQQIDLLGNTMVPGFVDAHGHVVSAGIQAASANLLPMPDGKVNNFTELSDTLSAWAESANGKSFIDKTGWLVGFGFDDSQLAEQSFPTKQLLDQISNDKPMMIIHQSGHFWCIQSTGS